MSFVPQDLPWSLLGPIASRPSPTAPNMREGYRYYATDTGLEYILQGGAWHFVGGSSGPPVQAAVHVYVSTTGSDSNSGLTPADPLLTPGAALAMWAQSANVKLFAIHFLTAGIYDLAGDANGISLVSGNGAHGPGVLPLVLVGDAPLTDIMGPRTVSLIAGQDITFSGAPVVADALSGARIRFTSGAALGKWFDIPKNTTTKITVWGGLTGVVNGDAFIVERQSVDLRVPTILQLLDIAVALRNVRLTSVSPFGTLSTARATLQCEFVEVSLLATRINSSWIVGSDLGSPSEYFFGVPTIPGVGGTNQAGSFYRAIYFSATTFAFQFLANGMFEGAVIARGEQGFRPINGGQCILAAIDAKQLAADDNVNVQLGIGSAAFASRITGSISYACASRYGSYMFMYGPIDLSSNASTGLLFMYGGRFAANPGAAITGVGNAATGISIIGGGNYASIGTGCTVAGPVQIQMEGVNFTYAALDAAVPKTLKDLNYLDVVAR